MWTRTYTHRTTADGARLWELLADVDGWVHWNDGVESITLDGPLAVGATFRMVPPGEDAITSTIVELEPPRQLTDLTELGGLAVRVEHRLDTAADGATTISADFPAVLAALAARASDGASPQDRR